MFLPRIPGSRSGGTGDAGQQSLWQPDWAKKLNQDSSKATRP